MSSVMEDLIRERVEIHAEERNKEIVLNMKRAKEFTDEQIARALGIPIEEVKRLGQEEVLV